MFHLSLKKYEKIHLPFLFFFFKPNVYDSSNPPSRSRILWHIHVWKTARFVFFIEKRNMYRKIQLFFRKKHKTKYVRISSQYIRMQLPVIIIYLLSKCKAHHAHLNRFRISFTVFDFGNCKKQYCKFCCGSFWVTC